jgi:hypothetical protein
MDAIWDTRVVGYWVVLNTGGLLPGCYPTEEEAEQAAAGRGWVSVERCRVFRPWPRSAVSCTCDEEINED